MKKAFSLVELIVVVSIIGVLAAVLMGTFSGGSESARAARCMGNLRNLGAACQSAGVALGHYPPAGSFEILNLAQGTGQVRKQYSEVKGWVSWNSQGAYELDSNGRLPTSSQASQDWNTSAYSASSGDVSEEEASTRWYALTNGALWKYVGSSSASYVCPLHAKTMRAKHPNWSYAMNAYFKWDYLRGGSFAATSPGYIYYGKLANADRRLLFAELPFVAANGIPVPEGTDETTDSVLQYEGCTKCGTPECIGFNHKSGKNYYANVCFADGHVEKLTFPKDMGESKARELTKWLCEGKEVSFDGKEYREMKN